MVVAGLNAAGISLFGQIDDLFIFDSPLDDATIAAQVNATRHAGRHKYTETDR